MSLLQNSNAIPAAGDTDFYTHQIPNSVRMVAPSSTAADNSRLTQTFSTVDSNVHFTLNFWIKRSAIEGNNPVSSARPLNMFTPRSGTSGSVLHEFLFAATGSYGAGDAFAITNTNTGAYILSTNNLFRDTSAWYNIHIQADLDNGTASEKLKIFINGTEADYNVDNRSSYSSMAGIVAGAWTIGDYYGYGYPIQSYLAQWAYVDGSTLAPTVFAEEKNGVWIPKDLSSGITWGNAGHLLMFQDSSNLGDDTSGEGNDWSSSNLSAHDQLLDSPTFGSSNGGNYCTLNPLFPDPTVARINDGMLAWGGSAGGGSVNEMGCMCTFAISPSDTNIYYFEGRMKVAHTGGVEQSIGVNVPTVDLTSDRGGRPTAWCITNTDYTRLYNGSNSYTQYDSAGSGSAGDIIGVKIDRANTTITFYKNGTLVGSQTNLNTTTDLYPWVGTGGSTSSDLGWDLNFGQNGTFNGLETAQGESDTTGYGNFYYDEAGSCKALCAGNLPVVAEIDPAQTDDNYPQKLFTALTYSGDGGGSQTIGFRPDLVWVKRRDGDQGHGLWDSTRGTTKVLNSDSNSAEGTSSGLTAFGSTGYTMGTYYNQSGNTYASWSWRANGGTTSTNSNGSITSTVQVDPSGCFSIITYTGDGSNSVFTVGHGLSAKPTFIIAKDREQTRNWSVWSQQLNDGSPADGDTLYLNTTDGETDQAGSWDVSNITSTLIGGVDGGFLNTGTNKQLFYAFTDCEGYIKSGSYVGNGDGSDGTFVYTGFRPAWILTKRLTTNSWRIQDNAMDTYNPAYHVLKPQSTAGQDAYTDGTDYNDFLSNGFKVARGGDAANFNASGETYVYLAIAHNPFKYATAR